MKNVYFVISVVFWGTIFISPLAYSKVYQCEDEGKFTFQQVPCESDTAIKCKSNIDYAVIGSSVNSSNNDKYCYKEQVQLEEEKFEKEKLDKLLGRDEESLKRKEQEAKLRADRHKASLAYEKKVKEDFDEKLEKTDRFYIEIAISEGNFYVEYFAIGSDIEATFTNSNGSIEQRKLPDYWHKAMSLPMGSYVSLSVQNQKEYGVVKVFIKVNGELVKQARSDASYGIASSSLLLPSK